MSEEEPTPRQLFAARLTELLGVTADLPLKRVVAEANRRRPTGRGRPVSGRRVSDWKRGRHLPESEAAFLVFVRVLIEHCRGRRVSSGQASPGLLDEEQWRLWLRAARNSPPALPSPAEPSEPAQDAGALSQAVAAGRWADECPYMGLAPFGHGHAEVFYGRKELTAQLVDALADRLDRPGILLVSGASGVGKSSLVRAGLLPALASGALSAESARWPVAVVQPTSRPIDELARVLAKIADRDPAVVRSVLEVTPEQSHVVVRDLVDARSSTTGAAAASTGDRLVLVVDQFEQIFTLPDDADPDRAGLSQRQRQDFITALHAAATRPCGPGGEPAAVVIAVIRADLLRACAAHTELAESAKEGFFLVGPMTSAQLRLTITGPAETAGLHIDPTLVDTILADLPVSSADGGYEVGALPLLSEAMRVTWTHRDGDRLTHHGYERSGGVAHAIQTSAEAVYQSLLPAQQDTARQVFHRLTKITRDGRAVRRPMPYVRRQVDPEVGSPGPPEALITVEGHGTDVPAGIEDVVDAFAAQRLLVVEGATAQITHDSLLQAWGRLRSWLQDEPAIRALYGQLGDDATEWARNGQPSSYLYRGERLAAVSNAQSHWRRAPDRYPALSQEEQDFLNASVKAEIRRVQRRWSFLIALAGLLVIAVATTVMTIRAARETTAQRDIAVSRQLAAQSRLLNDPETAALLAIAAWRINPTPEARASLIAVLLGPYQGRLTDHNVPISSVAFSPDGQTLAGVGGDGPLGSACLWDAAGRRIRPPCLNLSDRTGPARTVAFSPDGKTLAIGGDHGVAGVWDVATRRQAGPLLVGHTAPIRTMAFSPNGETLATGGDDHTVRLWDMASRQQIGAPLTGHTGPVRTLAFGPDGRTLATGGDDRTVRLWDMTGRQQIGLPLAGHTGPINTAAFSPDGKTLATAAEGAVRVWSVGDRRLRGSRLDHTAAVNAATYSPNGKILATADDDRTVRLWDVASRQQIGPPLTGHTGPVRTLASSPDGRTLATGGDDGTVRLWDMTGRQQIGPPLTGHTGPINTAAFSQDGKILATGSAQDRTVRLWDIAARQPVGGHPLSITKVNAVAFGSDGHLATGGDDHVVGLWSMTKGWSRSFPDPRSRINSLAFSPDGKTLATGDDDGTVQLWGWDQATPPSLRRTGPALLGHARPVNTVAFSPDGRTLASSANDHVRLWDMTTRSQIGPLLDGHTGPINTVAFSPDGKTLASSSDDHTVRLWNIALPGDLVNATCVIAGRMLEPGEWVQYVSSGHKFQNICPMFGEPSTVMGN
ncbi:hypothetical protein E1264_07080 [Actinomadura sp. KC216]|uniref:nSTAND1 domain-containing NTPase n=1 Tax=Actinomadura sp. KC216 TaxID=2530370 RepID=UPI00104CADDC|nr:AAA family ATPase [Actinomadura sp. KC216]TDB89857.1 hypothetical protein E1264_07080 [Actinomadura sp. KC216]